ncbi:MAG: phosphate acyltransferase PlsX [Gammaproteobacteria bacterium]|nr:phosphate acyltransferase PlsX [Gammaproteobacteria bacterium]
MTIRIAIDAMGGDHGPVVTVAAAAQALARHASLELVLVGDEPTLKQALAGNGLAAHARVSIEHATQVVEMHEKPSSALRSKRESSMRKAIDQVKDGRAMACVSAGNTGALMAIARFVLKTLPGIDRPAICATLPGKLKSTHVLDLGANVDSTSEELFRFAVMGAVLAEAVDNRDKPTVALLNIGEEEIKGNDRVKQTALLLENSPLNYIGFVEGDDIFAGKVDVIVCDGFVGNVALKASEGVARMLGDIAKEEFTRTLMTKLGALFARPALKALKDRADPRNYNGASLVGLRGIVIKSHGSADAFSFAHAIDVAVLETEKAVPERISHLLEELLAGSDAS